MLAPIVLFTYNRPLHTKKTIEALLANTLADESELFIYSDGPKNESATDSVNNVRSYLKTVTGFKTITIIERDRNWGLADSIIDGVTTIVNKYGKIIVLEDDVITSPHFLQFMNDALELYKDEDKVMHISGYFFPVPTTDLPDTFFYNQTSCWGWGTWARAWKTLNTDVNDLLEKITQVQNKNQYYRSCLSQLRANKRGDIKTWGARWQASVLLNQGYCLHPAISYVSNIGHDGSGINSTNSSIFSKDGVPQTKKITLTPTEIAENPLAVRRANIFYKTLIPNFYQRIIQIVKQKCIQK
jgi:hypothetical protein